MMLDLTDINLDLSGIKAIFFDFDGVFTDNNVYITEQGFEIARSSRYDGYGLSYLRSKSILVTVISSEVVPIASLRCKKLGINCFQPVQDKLAFATKYLSENDLSLDQLCFMGNDINDLSLLNACALPVIPSDAHRSLLDHHFYVTKASGGCGCIRELADHFALILQ